MRNAHRAEAWAVPEPIATADLTRDDLPGSRAPWSHVSWFALTMPQELYRSEDFDMLDAAKQAIAAGSKPAEVVPAAIDDQRRMLHAMQRRWRWTDGRERPHMGLCRALVAAIRRAVR